MRKLQDQIHSSIYELTGGHNSSHFSNKMSVGITQNLTCQQIGIVITSAPQNFNGTGDISEFPRCGHDKK